MSRHDIATAEEALVLRPGDTLILRVGSHWTRAQVVELADDIRQDLPESIKILVIAGVEQMAAAKP